MRFLKFLVFIALLSFEWAYAGAEVQSSVDSVNFGIVPANSIVSHLIVLKSTGDIPVSIDSVNLHCECLSLPLPSRIIPPGDSLALELKFNSSTYGGRVIRQIHIYTNVQLKPLRMMIRAFVVHDLESFRPVVSRPIRIIASQYGEKAVVKYPFEIVNKTDKPIPLKLDYTDPEYFDVNFPLYAPASGTAAGYLTLSPKGLESEFEKAIIFEFIDDNSEVWKYSIPIIRKIYKKGQN